MILYMPLNGFYVKIGSSRSKFLVKPSRTQPEIFELGRVEFSKRLCWFFLLNLPSIELKWIERLVVNTNIHNLDQQLRRQPLLTSTILQQKGLGNESHGNVRKVQDKSLNEFSFSSFNYNICNDKL